MKKRLCAILCMIWLVGGALSAHAISADHLEDLEQPLAGLIAAQVSAGMPYPADGDVSGEYARTYLFYMANIFYEDDAEPYAGGEEGFAEYAPIDEEEADALLKWAFGDLIEESDIEADGHMLIRDEAGLHLGIADGYEIAVRYAGDADSYEEDQPIPFDYDIALSDGGTRSGRAMVSVEARAGDADVPICVAGLSIERSIQEDALAGNWYAEDGYWCSIMDEGLIFCFNDQYEVIAEGTIALDGDRLILSIGGAEAEAAAQDGALVLTIAGQERTYQKEKTQ